MTIKEFFATGTNPNMRYAIHCDTREKAQLLCEQFRRYDYKWHDGESYADDRWASHGRSSCYCSDGYVESITWFSTDRWKIVEFDEFMQDKTLDTEDYVADGAMIQGMFAALMGGA